MCVFGIERGVRANLDRRADPRNSGRGAVSSSSQALVTYLWTDLASLANRFVCAMASFAAANSRASPL